MILNSEKRENVKSIDRHQHVKLKKDAFKPNPLTDNTKQHFLKKGHYIPLPETDPFVFPEQAF